MFFLMSQKNQDSFFSIFFEETKLSIGDCCTYIEKSHLVVTHASEENENGILRGVFKWECCQNVLHKL